MTTKYVLHLQKSVDRSWKYFYTVLKSAAIYLYKDKRTAAEVSFRMFLFHKQFIKLDIRKRHIDVLYKFQFQQPMAWEEAPLRLDDSKVEIADDYTKRKCVFRLKTSSGSECLFQVCYY